MPSLTATEAQRAFARTIEAAQTAPVQITRHGVTVAALISAEALAEYKVLKRLALHACITEGVQEAVGALKAGESRRGLGLFKALVPYWRDAGVESVRKR